MAAPDFSPILAGVDVSTIKAVVLTVAAMLCAVYVVIRGVRLIVRAIAIPPDRSRRSVYEWEGDLIEAGDYVPRSVFENHAKGMDQDDIKRYAKRAAKNGWWGQ